MPRFAPTVFYPFSSPPNKYVAKDLILKGSLYLICSHFRKRQDYLPLKEEKTVKEGRGLVGS